MKHDTAPLFDALRRFVDRGQAPFYSPGHKGGRTLDPWFRDHIAAIDLNNLPDSDTLHAPEGPILEAKRLIADAWQVGQSFILVHGSTGGNIAVAVTCCASRPSAIPTTTWTALSQASPRSQRMQERGRRATMKR